MCIKKQIFMFYCTLTSLKLYSNDDYNLKKYNYLHYVFIVILNSAATPPAPT